MADGVLTGRGSKRTAPLELVPYHPEWPRIFERERTAIVTALGDDARDTQHIGSTSVPGLAAKPIVDITVIVEALQPAIRYASRLEAIGYTFGISGEDYMRQIYWKKEPYPVNLHIVQRSSVANLQHILLRDHLRANPAAMREYEQLKRDNAEQFPWDVDRYIDGKTAFIEAIVAREAARRSILYPPLEDAPYVITSRHYFDLTTSSRGGPVGTVPDEERSRNHAARPTPIITVAPMMVVACKPSRNASRAATSRAAPRSDGSSATTCAAPGSDSRATPDTPGAMPGTASMASR